MTHPTPGAQPQLSQARFFFRRLLFVHGGGTWSIGYYPGGGMQCKWLIVYMPMGAQP